MDFKQENYEIWRQGVETRQYPPLAHDLEIDNLIIGGGVTGIMTAYLLSKKGQEVVLIEKGRLAGGASECTTAFLTQSVDTDYKDLAFMFGHKKAELVARSHKDAITLISDIAREEGLSDFFRVVVHRIIARDEKQARRLGREADAMAAAGLPVRFRTVSDLNIRTVAYVELADQALLQPLGFLYGLARRFIVLGGRIFEGTEARLISRSRGRWLVRSGNHFIRAKRVINLTYEPLGQPWHLYFKKGLYRSYVHEYEVPAGALPVGSYEDMDDPYHYFRVEESGPALRVIFGGEDHREDIKVDPERQHAILDKHAREILGVELELKRYWSGPILEPVDGLASIGYDSRDGLYYAFGFSGNGYTYAAIAAGLLSEEVSGEGRTFLRYRRLYSINRPPSVRALLIKGRDYASILWGGTLRESNFMKKIRRASWF